MVVTEKNAKMNIGSEESLGCAILMARFEDGSTEPVATVGSHSEAWFFAAEVSELEARPIVEFAVWVRRFAGYEISLVIPGVEL